MDPVYLSLKCGLGLLGKENARNGARIMFKICLRFCNNVSHCANYLTFLTCHPEHLKPQLGSVNTS
jgi:hypothetical protein